MIGGLSDWADPGWVTTSVRLKGDVDEASVPGLTIELIREVLAGGLMVPGDIVDGRHLRWTGRVDEWVERISEEWKRGWADEVPPPGEIVWLANTDAGDRVARLALERERRE